MKPDYLLLCAACALAGCTSFASLPGLGGSAKAARPAASAAVAREGRPIHHKDMLAGLLTYDRELRRMSEADVSTEQKRAGADRSVYGNMRQGLAYMHGHSAADAARCQAAFDTIGANAEAETRALAQLLASDCAELRRLYEQNERLAAQGAEAKRRADQLADTVESLKNIERSLPTRSAPRAAGVTR
jgi:hypothetical protein